MQPPRSRCPRPHPCRTILRSIYPLNIVAATLAILLPLAALAGCSSHRHRVDAPDAAVGDTPLAVRLNKQGLAAREEPDKAIDLFEKAVAADPYFGPAYNNLGAACLAAGRYHHAAIGLQQAARLMPESPQPRLNLGLTLETVGRLDDARTHYDAALAIAPDHLPAKQALARLLTRTGADPDRLEALLADLALTASDPAWRTWAQQQRTLQAN